MENFLSLEKCIFLKKYKSFLYHNFYTRLAEKSDFHNVQLTIQNGSVAKPVSYRTFLLNDTVIHGHF